MTKPLCKINLAPKFHAHTSPWYHYLQKNQLIYYFLFKIFSWIFLVHTKLEMQNNKL